MEFKAKKYDYKIKANYGINRNIMEFKACLPG